jgi:hypothetical protein
MQMTNAPAPMRFCTGKSTIAGSPFTQWKARTIWPAFSTFQAWGPPTMMPITG